MQMVTLGSGQGGQFRSVVPLTTTLGSLYHQRLILLQGYPMKIRSMGPVLWRWDYETRLPDTGPNPNLQPQTDSSDGLQPALHPGLLWALQILPRSTSALPGSKVLICAA